MSMVSRNMVERLCMMDEPVKNWYLMCLLELLSIRNYIILSMIRSMPVPVVQYKYLPDNQLRVDPVRVV